MTIQQAQQQCVLRLRLLYEEREAGNIADWVMEHITGKKRIDRLMDKQLALTQQEKNKLDEVLRALSTHQPIQYVLHEAWFAGLKFFVNRHVLIPRPETEELVEWIGETIAANKEMRSLIDIGTGSGCIPVTLKKKWPQLTATAIDVSDDALEVAQTNAAGMQAPVVFRQVDFLREELWDTLSSFDIIVSNPPYIRQSEHVAMSKNVLDFEPSIALFVPDNDALIFYRKLAVFGKKHLNTGGYLFVEINEALGTDTKQLFESFGYETELRNDLQGKERMIRAKKIPADSPAT